MSLWLFIFAVLLNIGSSDHFTITNETYVNSNGPNVLLKRLSNIDTNESVLVIYSPGGRLEEIKLRTQSKSNKIVSMISGHNKNASAIYENAHFKGCALMPWSNRIANGTYIFYGNKYNVPINEPERNDSLHGFLYNQTFQIENEEITSTYVSLILSITFSKKLNNLYPGYPFEFTVRIEYRLNNTGYFDIRVEAENIGDPNTASALPFYMGWHPYFNVKNVSQSIIELDQSINYDNLNCGGPNPQTAPLIPTGLSVPWTEFNGKNPIGVAKGNTEGMPTYYDDAYRVISSKNGNGNGNVNDIIRNRIIDPIDENTFVLWQQGKRFKFNQLYTGIAYQTNEQAIAFEPQSASTNAYNDGDNLSVLYPGQRFQAEFGFYVE